MNGRSSVYVLNVLRRIVRCEVDDIPLRLQGSDRRSGAQSGAHAVRSERSVRSDYGFSVDFDFAFDFAEAVPFHCRSLLPNWVGGSKKHSVVGGKIGQSAPCEIGCATANVGVSTSALKSVFSLFNCSPPISRCSSVLNEGPPTHPRRASTSGMPQSVP